MTDRLVQIIEANRDFVKAKVDANHLPTPQQLADFLRKLTNDLGPVVRFCPEEVVHIVKRGFAFVGWDTKGNRAASSTPPSPQKVLDFLTQTVEQIEEYRQQIRVSVIPTPEELNDMNLAASKIWQLDYTRLVPGVDYSLDLQDGKKPYQTGDMAERPLFRFVAEDVFEREAWSSFVALLDNYEAQTGQAEVVTAEERREEARFMNAIFQVPCMQYCHRYLVAKHKAPKGIKEFKELVHQLWFGLYRREVENDSSGFEHVFVGEAKQGKITGLHNWIQIYREERAGNLDYLGYIRPKVRGTSYTAPHEHEQLVTIQFSWNGEVKDVSSSFIGVSPAFEVALYTMCFLAGEEHNTLMVGPYNVEVTAFRMRHHGKEYIGTCFPSAVPGFTPEAGAAKIQAVFRGKKARQNRA